MTYRFDRRIRRTGIVFPVVALVFLIAACASTESPAYRFDVVDQPVPVSAQSEFDLRLTEASPGRPVSNATIDDSSLAMTHYRPSGKARGNVTTPMRGEVKFIGPDGPGLYRFMGDVSMPGTWKLKVSANVPGKSEPVTGTTSFKAGS
jgi:hypothetical protein